MLSLSRLFGRRPNAAAPEPASDDVYPVHLLDDMSSVAESTPILLMHFNDVLDSDMLHKSLVKLLTQGDWRKAGGRFRRDAAGKLHLRVPTPFTPQRPAVRYSHATFDTAIDEHPLASQLPKVTAQPSLQHSAEHFSEFCWTAGAPGSLGDFLKCDDAPVALRITSFLDATLVAVSWSHVLTDTGGIQELVSAWCKVLAGRDTEVAPVSGAREDVAAAIWEEEPLIKETYIWEAKLLTGLRFLFFALRFVWRLIWQPKVGSRTLFLPAPFIARLREEADQALTDGAFVSDGDILCVWLSRLIVSTNKWSGPVTLLNVVDIRSRVPSVFQQAAVYIQNLTMPSLTFLKGADLISGSLGKTASQIRQSISLQTSEAQVRAIYRTAVPYVKAKGRPPIFGDPNMLLVPISNWSKARFILSTDFSSAVIQSGETGPQRRNPPGHMVYQITCQVKNWTVVRDAAMIIGKDHSGNYWVNLYIAEPMFAFVEEYVRNAGEASACLGKR